MAVVFLMLWPLVVFSFASFKCALFMWWIFCVRCICMRGASFYPPCTFIPTLQPHSDYDWWGKSFILLLWYTSKNRTRINCTSKSNWYIWHEENVAAICSIMIRMEGGEGHGADNKPHYLNIMHANFGFLESKNRFFPKITNRSQKKKTISTLNGYLYWLLAIRDSNTILEEDDTQMKITTELSPAINKTNELFSIESASWMLLLANLRFYASNAFACGHSFCRHHCPLHVFFCFVQRFLSFYSIILSSSLSSLTEFVFLSHLLLTVMCSDVSFIMLC